MALSQEELRILLERMAHELGSQRELAKQLGISEAHLSDVLHYHRGPGKKLLKAMGLQKLIMYKEVAQE